VEIAVIVPTYNRADLIGETLDSILRQSYHAAEIIVVDDGSTDNTESVVARYGSAVKYLRIANSGECAARNAGVACSSAPWVAFCDSDDLWLPEKLKLQVKVCQEVQDVDYCFTNFRTVMNGDWSDMSKFETSPDGYWDLPRDELTLGLYVVRADMFPRLLRHQPIFPSTVLMKKTFFDAVGRWNESLGRTRSVDLEFHLRCVVRPPVGVVAAPVVGIRKHLGNFSSDAYRTTLGEIEILRYVLENHVAARKYQEEIRRTIEERSAQAAGVAFASGDFTKTRQLLASVPLQRRSWKLHLKAFISHAPERAASLLRSWCVQNTAGN
jgi:glycosyltransferase involved in cell wall biosynthesis